MESLKEQPPKPLSLGGVRVCVLWGVVEGLPGL